MKTTNLSLLLSLLLVIALFVSGCQTGGAQPSRATQGAAIGAVGGALYGQALGRSTEATLLGAAIGLVGGYMIGNEMDKADLARVGHAYETMPSGQTSTWRNPDSGHQYSVTPQPSYQRQNRVCRDANISAVIDGRHETIVQTACRRPDGTWEMQR